MDSVSSEGACVRTLCIRTVVEIGRMLYRGEGVSGHMILPYHISCDTHSLWWALHNCPSLQCLDITGNRRVTGQVSSLSAHACTHNILYIQCFYLIGVPPLEARETKVKDQTTTMVKGHLKTLLLEDCVGVRDEGISLLSQYNEPVLEVVNMSHCQLLTGVAVHSVAMVSSTVAMVSGFVTMVSGDYNNYTIN